MKIMSSELLTTTTKAPIQNSNNNHHHHQNFSLSTVAKKSIVISPQQSTQSIVVVKNLKKPPSLTTTTIPPTNNKEKKFDPSSKIEIISSSMNNSSSNISNNHLRHLAHSPIEYRKNIIIATQQQQQQQQQQYQNHQNNTKILLSSTTKPIINNNNNDLIEQKITTTTTYHHQQQSQRINPIIIQQQQNQQQQQQSIIGNNQLKVEKNNNLSLLNPIIIINDDDDQNNNITSLTTTTTTSTADIQNHHLHHHHHQHHQQNQNHHHHHQNQIESLIVNNQINRSPPTIINNNNNNNNSKIQSLIQQFNAKEMLTTTTSATNSTETKLLSTKANINNNSKIVSSSSSSLLSYKNDNDDRKANNNDDDDDNEIQKFKNNVVVVQLPEGNVDDDDDDDNDNDDDYNDDDDKQKINDKLNHNHNNDSDNDDDDDDDDDDLEDREIVYEIDADDEQSNDMLDDEEEEDDEDEGPKSTSPGPVAAGSIVTKIDPSTKSMIQVISIMKNSSSLNNNEQSSKTTLINNNVIIDNNDNKKIKEIQQAAESEDSAADVSYERTSDLAESDIDETTTITTVNTNIDCTKELSYEQKFKITQNIWYLPHINRATVVHYLQGKTVGVFIVRQSSKPNTMAVSVRLPQGRGPHVEHYLIEKIIKTPNINSSLSSTKLSSVFRLEGSEHYFNTMLQLVLHYSRCQDELPVQLNLPSVLLNSSHSQLTSLALLGQEFWQSKFVMLKHLPKNSLNNETLAMINHHQQNEQNQLEESTLHNNNKSMIKQNNNNNNRQQARRHNSNSSESNQSKSSLSPSLPPMIRSRRNTSDSVSPIQMSSSITPPPLPPKNSTMICDPSLHRSNSPIINAINAKKTMINEEHQKTSSSPITIVEVHHNNHNNTNSTIKNMPINKLPPRIPNYVPPPIPPRNHNRNSPNNNNCSSTTTPPPLSSLRTKKPQFNLNQQQQQQKPLLPQDLLSPISMTESEIEMAKFLLSHKIVSNILEVEEYEEENINDNGDDNRSLMFRNYYNQMIEAAQQKSSPIQIVDELIKQQQTPSPSPAPQQQHSFIQTELRSDCVQQSSIKCDVCTQTYDTNKLMPNQQQQQQQHGRITRANSSLSCFYMDPIDALVAIHHQQPKRHSDPELASTSQNTVEGSSILNQTFTMSHSFESLLENFRNRFATNISSSDFNSIRETIINERQRNQLINQNQNEQQQQQQKCLNQKHDTGFSTVDSAWQWHSGGNNNHNHNHNQQIQNLLSTKIAQQIEHSKRLSIATTTTTTNGSIKSDITTVEDLISAKVPELAVPKITNIVDLVNKKHHHHPQQPHDNFESTTKSTATDFSEPWNMDIVESLFISELNNNNNVNHHSNNNDIDYMIDNDDNDSTKQLLNNDLINFNSFLLNQDNHQMIQQMNDDDYDSVADDEFVDELVINDNNNKFNINKRNDSDITIKDNNKNNNNNRLNDNGIKLNIAFNISNYVFELAARNDNTFAKSIENFIECTKETTDPNPSVILGYVRQFMNGMKNYLIKHGEGDFLKIVQNERSRLRPNQFLNIDSILEVSLQKLIIKPLKNFLYELFIRQHQMSGSLKILSTNIKLAQNKTPEELGIRKELLPIETKILSEIQKNIRKLQQSYSPIKKLEHLLKCIAILNSNYKEKKITTTNCDQEHQQQQKYNRAFSGDDLLPMLVYLIVHCGVISAEIESEYMLGLLHPSILNGEASYYLTILSSAIQVLKTMYTADNSRSLEDIIILNNNHQNQNNQNNEQSIFSMLRSQPSKNFQQQINCPKTTKTSSISSTSLSLLPSIASMQAYMKIMIPNELTSNITCKTVPVRHNMTTKEVCKMIAHTFRITNPEDYSLYRIKENGLEEIQLLDNEYPQVIKSELIARGESTMFAYKRCDAKFIWPITSPN